MKIFSLITNVIFFDKSTTIWFLIFFIFDFTTVNKDWLEMLGELNTPVGLSIWDKILLIKSKRVHALRDKI